MTAKKTSQLCLTLAGLLLLTCAPAFAHHGSAVIYDVSRIVTVDGIVTRFAWSNPHVLLYLDVKDDRGKVVHWICEMTSPGVLARSGWYKDKLKPGDKIKLLLHPSNSGEPFGQFDGIVFPDGTRSSAKEIERAVDAIGR